jgi:predicted metal-binding protein
MNACFGSINAAEPAQECAEESFFWRSDMDRKYQALIERSLALGAQEAKLVSTSQIVFDPRSHIKCRFGCGRWGKFWTCPPHLSLSMEAFMNAFQQYKSAIIITTADPMEGQKVAVALEKEAMLSHGCTYAFALALCVQCEKCAYPEPCKFPHLARPTMDAYGVDVGKTLEPLGFEVKFDKEGKLLPFWYSMVLLD